MIFKFLVPKAFVVKADQSLTEDEVKKYVAGKIRNLNINFFVYFSQSCYLQTVGWRC